MRRSARVGGTLAELETVGAQAEIYGAVLCGGSSRRMGDDKALLPVAGLPMLQHSIQTLQALTSRVFLASGSSPRYAEFGLPEVLDRFADAGPLAGLEAALTHVESQSKASARAVLCVLACDMPRAKAGVFEALLGGLADNDAAVLGTSLGHEPLYAVYRLSVLPSVRRALEEGRRRVDAFFGDVRLEILDAPDLSGAALNVNTPEDYKLEQGS